MVDVEIHKPSLIEAVKDATGRELVLDGPMKLSVFPVPRHQRQRVIRQGLRGRHGRADDRRALDGASPSGWLHLGPDRGGRVHALPAQNRRGRPTPTGAQLAVPAGRRGRPSQPASPQPVPSGGRRA